MHPLLTIVHSDIFNRVYHKIAGKISTKSSLYPKFLPKRHIGQSVLNFKFIKITTSIENIN